MEEMKVVGEVGMLAGELKDGCGASGNMAGGWKDGCGEAGRVMANGTKDGFGANANIGWWMEGWL